MTVSIPVSTCPSCGAVANPRWTECLACAAPLSGPAQSTPSQRPGTAPETAPTPSPGQTPPPNSWTAAAARLRRINRPTQVSPKRWQQVITDADRLLGWAPMLVAMDWTAEDVFGRDDLDRKSLAWLVCGQRIGPATSIAIVLRAANGALTHIYRRSGKDTGDAT